ncbi:mitochondrial BirA family transcriptional regulator biotin operon repressor/biotin-[acetyl-CoA-carboxylase] ligase [Andalucia godoyi]|uniref:Mitochondrial BirA family transcriptional regulator biotin operon repressor/biotin-[acetyl-CoA-carboxylase] ligase n=1 Tax=Andalucia godoyi TaxID=505711 RepID=A0A8K0AI99_ANDGO|nr:mitochondrial BirA family transcriptional regulator biotin operon repressor/biotin-[acetyl-CoA-carboxylase] ligase [Andalucia godoyi]|eukprot:ANDGO_00028.mRNA.1 mitochondrial BirA family transcriptional regulator biotin operon repressor/biotin-[acetyl-CoA-carboxylase] ligase
MFSKNRFLSLLRTRRFFREVLHVESCTSTMDLGAEMVASATTSNIEGSIIITDQQTRGRGTKQRSFESSRTGNVYTTLVFSYDSDEYPFPPLFLVRAVPAALCDAISSVGVSSPPMIKWPNDVWIAGKKTAGILIETSSMGPRMTCFVGIGVNLNTNPSVADPALKDIATCVKDNVAATEDTRDAVIDREEFLVTFCEHLEKYLSPSYASVLEHTYRERSVIIGRRVRVFPNGVVGVRTSLLATGAPDACLAQWDGVALSVDSFGFLKVRRDDTAEEVVLSAEEVSLRLV